MADKYKFENLSDEAKEAVTPRGEYKNPDMLKKGTSIYEGAPDSPQPVDEDVISPQRPAARRAMESSSSTKKSSSKSSDDDADKTSSTSKRRTS